MTCFDSRFNFPPSICVYVYIKLLKNHGVWYTNKNRERTECDKTVKIDRFSQFKCLFLIILPKISSRLVCIFSTPIVNYLDRRSLLLNWRHNIFQIILYDSFLDGASWHWWFHPFLRFLFGTLDILPYQEGIQNIFLICWPAYLDSNKQTFRRWRLEQLLQ